MINIKGFTIISEEEVKGGMFDDIFTEDRFVKPIFKNLPDFDGLNNEEKKEYLFRDIKKGSYLVGLEIISEKFMSCGVLLNYCGLVVSSVTPILKQGEEESLYLLTFRHISDACYNNKITVE
jgi:hypothetical protein